MATMMPEAIQRPGTLRWIMDSEKSHAPSTAKAGLTNSEGWIDCPANEIHRRAPLTSVPNRSVAQSRRRLTTSVPSAQKRACRGVRNEVTTSTASAGTQNMAWRMMKCQGESPRRSATGGLAAKLSTMPQVMSRISAPSSSRSMDHHHSARGVFSARENIMGEAGLLDTNCIEL